MRFYPIKDNPPPRTAGLTFIVTRVTNNSASFIYEAYYEDDRWLLAGLGCPLPIKPTHWADSKLDRLPGSRVWYDNFKLELLIGATYFLVNSATTGWVHSVALSLILALYGVLCSKRQY